MSAVMRRRVPAVRAQRKSYGQVREAAVRLARVVFAGRPKGHVMRRFVAGLLLGMASMYWYAYQKDAFLQAASDWFAEASADPNAKENINKMMTRKH
jgi:hypothetical protein